LRVATSINSQGSSNSSQIQEESPRLLNIASLLLKSPEKDESPEQIRPEAEEPDFEKAALLDKYRELKQT
jgi:hypothetical protein